MAVDYCRACGREMNEDASICERCHTPRLSGTGADSSEPTVLLPTANDPLIPRAAATPPHAPLVAGTAQPASALAAPPLAAVASPISDPAPSQVAITTAATSPGVLKPETEDNNLGELADRAWGVALRVVIFCAVAIGLMSIYIAAPVAAPPPLPAGVATMITANGTTTGSPLSSATTDESAYLAFLSQADQQRKSLAGSFDQELAATTPPATNTFVQSAQDELRLYLAQKVPASCNDLSNAYFRLLQDQTAIIAKGGALLTSGDIKGALAARDAAAAQITQDAQAADAAMVQFCNTQHLPKPFDVITGSAVPAPQPPSTPNAAPTPALSSAPPPTAAPTSNTPGPASPATAPGPTSSSLPPPTGPASQTAPTPAGTAMH